MIMTRNKQTSHVLADSGGFQIASGKLEITDDQQRENIYNWQSNYSDYGMTLDVPVKAVENKNSLYETFDECLNDTIEHVERYEHYREQNKFPLLNVLQGRNQQEADKW